MAYCQGASTIKSDGFASVAIFCAMMSMLVWRCVITGHALIGKTTSAAAAKSNRPMRNRSLVARIAARQSSAIPSAAMRAMKYQERVR
ncbi:MAG: hypothetical protein DME38_08625 [Verrucomicrobia bacterium]|nr:MAG: hypothetical protein DME38_08625 [Verrucomicrobiota bacterium]